MLKAVCFSIVTQKRESGNGILVHTYGCFNVTCRRGITFLKIKTIKKPRQILGGALKRKYGS